MTILGVFLNDELRTGGHVRYLELMEGLAGRGNAVAVLLNEKLEYRPRNFAAVRVPAAYRRKSFPPASAVFARCARAGSAAVLDAAGGRADAVVVFGETHLAAGTALARAAGAKLVYGHRSNAVGEARAYRAEARGAADAIRNAAMELKARLDERRIARRADLAVFQSPYDETDFLSRNPAARGRTAVIRGNIGEPRFAERLRGTNRSAALARIAFVGTLGRRKGVQYLLEAYAILRGRGTPLPKLEVYGPGDLGPFAERIAHLGLGGAVEYRGKTAEPMAAIAAADLVVVPSLYDSYPNVVLEALHVGTPVIGSAVGGIPDMLGDAELLFPPADAAALADRIGGLIADPARYADCRRLSAERADAFRFDWSAAWEARIGAACGAQAPASPA